MTSAAIDAVAPQLLARTASFVKENRLPGASVGIVHGDELAWFAGVGFADVEARRVPDCDTLYRVASITKTFTGTAIMQLRDEGRLHLDHPAVQYLPELRGIRSPFGPVETLTIRRLLSHESGLTSEPPGTDWSHESGYEGRAEVNLARAGEFGLAVPPNSQAKYSNLGFQLLGEIVARLCGMPFSNYVQHALLDPLDMQGSGFDPLPADLSSRCATGYAPRTFSDALEPARFASSIGAEGGLWSCTRDLARWLSLQFRTGLPRSGAQVLAGASLAEMHRARYLIDDSWILAQGIAWYSTRRNDVTWVMHSGDIHGFVSDICFDARTKVGAIVLLNGYGDAPSLALDLAAIARDAVRAVPPSVEPWSTVPDAYASLLGLYVDSSSGVLYRVEWRDGALAVLVNEAPSWRPLLQPTDTPDEYVVAPGVRESGERVVFVRRDDGRVSSMFFPSLTLLRLEPVESP